MPATSSAPLSATDPAAQQDDEGLSPAEQAVIAALAVWFASTAAVTATVLPAALTARLVTLGLSPRAVRAAGRIVMAPPLTGRRRYGSPSPAPGATVARQVAADEPEARARYLLNAARRLTEARTNGVYPQALRMEQRYLDAHVEAGRNRARAAAALDRVAADHGPWLVWRTAGDARVEAECAALEGTVFTADNLPGGFLPGAVHPRCRCRAAGLADPFHAQPTVS